MNSRRNHRDAQRDRYYREYQPRGFWWRLRVQSRWGIAAAIAWVLVWYFMP